MTTKQGSRTLPLLAALGGIGFAVHLLLGGSEPEARHPAPEPSPPASEPPVASAREVAAPRRTATKTSSSAAAAEPALDAQELEELAKANPEEALVRLARSLPRTERDAQRLKLVEVRALLAQGKIGAARGRAHDYFERWPNGPDIATLQQLTGAHPSR
jgi:hypothetical protein